jgi:hypothetical protein
VWAFFDYDLFMTAGKILYLFNVAHFFDMFCHRVVDGEMDGD